MTYKYSICYPDKEKIELKNEPISGKEVLNIARNHPWLEQLKISDLLDRDKVYYCPSIDFNCIENGKSFCLTADMNKAKQLEFSLWFNRPKKVKVFFGLLGETEKMTVDDVWGFNFDESLKYLDHFISGNYQIIESLYKK